MDIKPQSNRPAAIYLRTITSMLDGLRTRMDAITSAAVLLPWSF
jgi:hypothetical protein